MYLSEILRVILPRIFKISTFNTRDISIRIHIQNYAHERLTPVKQQQQQSKRMEEQSSRLQSSEHRHQYRPRDTSVAPFDWQTYFPNVEYDFTDRRCELTSALIDAFCGVENGERLFDEVRRAFCCLRLCSFLAFSPFDFGFCSSSSRLD